MSDQPAFSFASNHLDGPLHQARADAALTSTNLFQNEVYGQAGATTTGGFDPYRFAGSSQAAAGRDVYGYSGRDRQPVAADNANPQLEQAKKILTDRNSSSIDKLHVVQALANAGVKQIDLPDADGNSRTYSIRSGQIGGKTMVHLFANDDQGKEHIVLRGVVNGSGSFNQEHDDTGSPVDFEGTWWQEHMSGRSLVGTSPAQEQATDQSQVSDPYRYNGGSKVVCRIRGDSAADTNATDDTTNSAGSSDHHLHHRRGGVRHHAHYTQGEVSSAVPNASFDATESAADYT